LELGKKDKDLTGIILSLRVYFFEEENQIRGGFCSRLQPSKPQLVTPSLFIQ